MKSYPLESLNYFLNTSLLGHLSQARPPWLLHNSGPCPPFLQSRLMLMLLWTLVVLPLHLSPETREIVFACSKRVNTIFPLQAEAEAIKWSLTLTANLEFEAIIIESDSQVCSNLLSDLEAAPPPPPPPPPPPSLENQVHLC